MKLHVLDMPNETAELAAWLEGYIRGTKLHELVSECRTMHDDTTDSLELFDLLTDRASEVLSNGLGVLSFDEISQLIRHPQLLFDLQDWVMVEGGDYWQDSDASDSEKSAALWQRVQTGLNQQTSPTVQPRSEHTHSAWPKVLAVMALGLIVAVGYFVTRPDPTPQVAWGWAKPGALNELDQLPASEYMENLAKSAESWFKKRPDTKEALAKRIKEFRIGCDVLVDAKHSPLTSEDRTWLIERCKAWSAKLDQHTVALDAGANVLETRAAADETINGLVKAIQTRIQTS